MIAPAVPVRPHEDTVSVQAERPVRNRNDSGYHTPVPLSLIYDLNEGITPLRQDCLTCPDDSSGKD